jgi:hypothetical protein
MASRTPVVVDFGDKYLVDDSPVETVLMRGIFGEDFQIVQDVNTFGLLSVVGDEAAGNDVVKMMISLVADLDKPRFRSTIARQRHLDAPKLVELFNDMLEVASGGRPTTSSNGSAPGTRKKAVGARSKASSSASSGQKALPR